MEEVERVVAEGSDVETAEPVFVFAGEVLPELFFESGNGGPDGSCRIVQPAAEKMSAPDVHLRFEFFFGQKIEGERGSHQSGGAQKSKRHRVENENGG